MADLPSTDRTGPASRDDADLWDRARQLTQARIGLARAGGSLATAPLLEFRLAHAVARDAVHSILDPMELRQALEPLGLPVVIVSSAATTSRDYLLRPDLGRQLSRDGTASLAPHAGPHDLVFVVADGLSASAVARHAAPLLEESFHLLEKQNWRIGPIVVVERGRVGIGDRIAAVLKARAVVVLIGERPGLSAPDSMGLYITWEPGPRTTDADRNCISNIRPAGLPYGDAAFKLNYLMQQMAKVGLSGVRLKDNSSELALSAPSSGGALS